MGAEVERYIIELGTEGRLIEMQLEETVVGVMGERVALVRDYSLVDSERARRAHRCSELATAARTRSCSTSGASPSSSATTARPAPSTSPCPHAATGRYPAFRRLPRLVVQKVVQTFGDLDAIVNATEDELAAIDGVGAARAREIREGLRRLARGRLRRPLSMNRRPLPRPSQSKEDDIPELATADDAIEDIEDELGPVECTFDEGDNVVYPHHGAGVVMKKETKDLLGEKRDYLTIKILHNDMTVMVPCENAHRAGLRRVIDG